MKTPHCTLSGQYFVLDACICKILSRNFFFVHFDHKSFSCDVLNLIYHWVRYKKSRLYQ